MVNLDQNDINNSKENLIQFTINSKHNQILFPDDITVIISNPHFMTLERNLNIVFKTMKKRFNSNLLSLNFDETYY